jgi:hypothetical protein
MEQSTKRLKIIRVLPSSKKVKLVQVIINGVPQKLALEETSKGRFRDQKRHFWVMNGNDELVAIS